MNLTVAVVVALAAVAAWWMWSRRREGMANPQISDEMLAQFSQASGQPITRDMLEQAVKESKMTPAQLLEDLKKAPTPGMALGADPAPTLAAVLECKKAGTFTAAPKDGKCPDGKVLLPSQNGGLCASKACAEAYGNAMVYYNGDINLMAQHLMM